MTIREMKRRQRAEGIAARCAAAPEVRAAWDHEIAKTVLDLPAFECAEVILSYCAVRCEADPWEIDEAARRFGKRVAYPICCGSGHMFAAEPEDPYALQRGMYGIREPVLGHYRIVPPGEIDVVLAPCSAFDSRCLRVGMGGGYYDRYLGLCPQALSMALAYEVQKVDFAAAEMHDVFLDAVVTEKKHYRTEEGRRF